MPRDGTEIGRPKQGVRRKRAAHSSAPKDAMPASAHIDQDPGLDREQQASTPTTPNSGMPAAPPIADVETRQRRRRTSVRLTPNKYASAVAPIGPDHSAGTGGDGHCLSDTHLRNAISAPIEPVATPSRKRRANHAMTPTGVLPGVSPIGQDASSDREQRAMSGSTPTQAMPAAPSIGHNSDASDEHVATVVTDLKSLQKRRIFSIVQKNRSERAIETLIAGEIGFQMDATEKQRKAVFAAAKAMRLAVERGGEGHVQLDIQSGDALSALAPMILISAKNRAPWVKMRKKIEKEMQQKARELPVYEFAKSIKGFGDLGLACLAGEAGIPMGQYRTVSALWKRMGLAVIGNKEQWHIESDVWVRHGQPAPNDKRQRRCSDATEADIHGYVPRRRAEVWAFCSDSMFRHQWNGANEETGEPAGPAGPYGEVYANRRAHTAPCVAATVDLDTKDPNKWTDGRCHNDARRVMSKALLRDLWRVWNGMPPRYAGEAE